MGLFDGLKRNKKAPVTVSGIETVASAQQSDSEVELEDAQLADYEPEELSSEAVSGQQEGEYDVVSEPEPEPEEPQHAEASSSDGSLNPASRVIKPYSEKSKVDHVIGQTKIMSIINQKGGVGKSTTAINLSAILGTMKKQVLLVDLDPQGNATSGLGIDKRALDACVYDVLLNGVPVEDVIIPDVTEGLDVVPATINLAGAEVELVSEFARENRLKDSLGSLRGKYDYIIIDCPPSLGLLTINGLVAADSLLIPIQSEFYALEGVTKLLDSMKLVKSRLNPSLEIYGVLITMYDARTTLSKQISEEVRNYFGKKVFETPIPRTVKLSEAPSYGMPINEYDPSGKGAQAYRAVAKEVIERGKNS